MTTRTSPWRLLALSLPMLAVAGCGAADREVATEDAQLKAAAEGAVIAPGAAEVDARLATSPRHAEWAVVRTSPTDSVRAWVVYPERNDPAPVVLVVHEIFGVSNWVRGVADQLAADGFIAIAPDLLTMKNVPNTTDGEPNPDEARAAIATLRSEDVHRDMRAVAEYGMSLPAALPRYGVVGYCWGGSTVFSHAIASPELGAAVVYYGASPETSQLSAVQAPVLGLYGENDERVNATIAPADSALKALGRTYEYHIFEGAGHGFLRQQDGQNGANLAASQEAWPLTISWFRQHLQ